MEPGAGPVQDTVTLVVWPDVTVACCVLHVLLGEVAVTVNCPAWTFGNWTVPLAPVVPVSGPPGPVTVTIAPEIGVLPGLCKTVTLSVPVVGVGVVQAKFLSVPWFATTTAVCSAGHVVPDGA